MSKQTIPFTVWLNEEQAEIVKTRAAAHRSRNAYLIHCILEEARQSTACTTCRDRALAEAARSMIDLALDRSPAPDPPEVF